ncbi:MAG: hypothetical protein NZ480_07455, partial [Bdellovibrionaceae bacterium]|nr:hypothetical protein [Pseudobdellovibrionaceae bacterium]
MNHHLLKMAAYWLRPIFWGSGLFMLLRGHNEPGGGFVGGLLVSLSYVMAYFRKEEKDVPPRILGQSSEFWLFMGLLIAWLSVIIGAVGGEAFMKGLWWGGLWLPIVGDTKIGTPFLFDTGVFFV